MTYGISFAALADPTRRAIVEKLAQSPACVADIARDFPISRPAVSQHLKVLCDAGLLSVTPVGARRQYQLERGALLELRAWFDKVWDDALQAFAAKAIEIAHKKEITDGT